LDFLAEGVSLPESTFLFFTALGLNAVSATFAGVLLTPLVLVMCVASNAKIFQKIILKN
jgi:hypothetical protein